MQGRRRPLLAPLPKHGGQLHLRLPPRPGAGPRRAHLPRGAPGAADQRQCPQRGGPGSGAGGAGGTRPEARDPGAAWAPGAAGAVGWADRGLGPSRAACATRRPAAGAGGRAVGPGRQDRLSQRPGAAAGGEAGRLLLRGQQPEPRPQGAAMRTLCRAGPITRKPDTHLLRLPAGALQTRPPAAKDRVWDSLRVGTFNLTKAASVQISLNLYSWFLAVFQIINKNQHEKRSPTLSFAPSPSLLWAQVWDGRQGGNATGRK